MTHLLSRRSFFASAIVFGTAALAPLKAFALSNSQAETLVDRAVNDINAVISSGRSEASMIRSFEGIFRDYGDTAYIAAFALGNDRRSASSTQIRTFTEAFNGYIARKYGRRFREFAGGQIVVQGASNVSNYIEVQTLTTLRNKAPFRVDFHVSDRPGHPVFFNIIIEGVNMLLSERTEIGAMLDRRGGDIDALISDLRNV
ncbi:phospholipid-binding protein MlaC [Aestuariibius sp. HNIBRBA575]|uniref:MlaC/ttg2D family ABC transporter substrate-binding protein n=1 Tax=Aestuariibius sp. HNIBRBA575 TaxID=3233343 RepID=UPI0034A3920D